MRSKIVAVCFLMLASMMFPVNAPAQDLCGEQVMTGEGPVIGKSAQGADSCAYLGVPYAAPPVGELRFKAPQPAAKHDKAFEAFEFGPSCIQKENFGGGGKSKSFSEDCLQLNIWRPKKPGTYPVMFWIYGGGFVQGSSYYPMYNGANVAAMKDVVIVSINYRIGLLGYLALEKLAKEDPNGSAGNYGMLDQIHALRWVKENIAAFGGDPNNITIFGHSAGGVSVCNLLASPPAAGLFHKAIIQSGACDMAIALDKGYKQGLELVDSMGCGGENMIDCLRKKPAAEFKEARIITAWPHIDGYALKAMPIESIKNGEYNKVPVMVGSTLKETDITAFLMPILKCASRKSVVKRMRNTMGPLADEALKMYSFDDFRRPIYLALQLGDDGFGARAFSTADRISRSMDVYMYRYDWDDFHWGDRIGAFHGVELPLVFGNYNNLPGGLGIGLLYNNEKVWESAKPISETSMSYWTNFAKTGNPNGGGLPEWPKYSTDTKQRLIFDNKISVAPINEKDLKRYEFLSSHTVEELTGGNIL